MDSKIKSSVRKQTTSKKNISKVKNQKKKSLMTTENILLAVFVVLLILVVVLAIMVFNKSRENKDKINADLAVPILELNSEENISLTTSVLAEKDEYVIRITNYKDDKVIAEEVSYAITIENDSLAIVKVTKDNSSDDLMKSQKSTVIENQKLKGNEKEDIYYHISVTKKNKINKDDKVNIKIAS